MCNSRIPAITSLTIGHCVKLQTHTAMHTSVTSEWKCVWEDRRSPANLGEVEVNQCQRNEASYILKQLSAGIHLKILPLEIYIHRLRYCHLL